MSSRLKSNLIKYGLTAVFCGLLVWYFVSLRDVANKPLVEQYRIWCDAFFTPGGLLIMFGLLIKIASGGMFDGITYGLRTALQSLIPGGRLKQEKYYDYVQRKQEKREENPLNAGFLFIMGGLCLAVAAVFMVLFYSLYGKTSAF